MNMHAKWPCCSPKPGILVQTTHWYINDAKAIKDKSMKFMLLQKPPNIMSLNFYLHHLYSEMQPDNIICGKCNYDYNFKFLMTNL